MKNKRKLTISLLLVGLIGLTLSFINKDDDPVDRIVAALQKWADTNPQEKVYLQTDKPYYLVGDTIWFKAYVTTGSRHQLSAISGALYVDLISEGDSLTKQLKLPITTGMAVGNFILDDDLVHEGNYRIRAYTQWMRNAGPEYFYDRTFSVGNSIANTVFAKIDYIYTQDGNKVKIKAVLKYTDQNGQPLADKQVSYLLRKSWDVISSGGGKTNAAGELSINLPNNKPNELLQSYLNTKIIVQGANVVAKNFPIKTASNQTDVQFFPEGGNLVAGLKSRVAFKATAPNGLGAGISGVVTDNAGTEVAKLETKHLGMGYFTLTPEASKTYAAKVTYPDGSSNTINLPQVQPNGYTLSVFQTSKRDSVLVKVGVSAGAHNGGSLSLVGQSNGKVYFSSTVPVNKTYALLYFPTREVPSGIMQFTLFNADAQPLNERIVFIQNEDNINVGISSDKKIYSRREKVRLNIDAKDAAGNATGGNFSVSVISETAVPSDEVNENSIFSQLLLSSDIKGYIEKPNYYFTNQNDQTRENLDILMLTQGYRRFEWKNILSGNIAAPYYTPEKLGTEISGVIMGYNKKPIPYARVALLNNKTGFFRDTVADQNGRFKFRRILFTEGAQFTIQGAKASGKGRVIIKLNDYEMAKVTPNPNIGDLNPDILQQTKATIDNDLKQDQDLTSHGLISRVQQLKEVRIRAAKARFGTANINENQADEVYRPDSRQPCSSLRECLEEMYHSRVRFNQVMDQTYGMLWIPTYQNERYVVLIDAMRVTPEQYQDLLTDSVTNISKIYMVHESPAIQMKLLGMYSGQYRHGPPPVLAIFTKNGNYRYQKSDGTIDYAPKGYDLTRVFYSPKYDVPQNGPTVADLRSTVYWNPAVLTGAAGHTTIGYFNSDQTGTFRVTIEGINADGQLARKVYRYTVQ
ncbi:TonB-dependent receptor [Mucilaginibacter ximonensis]|uniref:TonB-dependent receptor n=1 Tax=Mucilaginibacter ximonensis TaxID=538021 RepID=A0ABW5YG35_9SPHI